MSENILLRMEEFQKVKDFWMKKLEGDLQEIKLPPDYYREGKYERGGLAIAFPPEITTKLLAISKNQDLALFVFLLAALKILLAKYTNQNDIMVASPVLAATGQSMNEQVILRDILTNEMTFKDLLFKVKQTTAESYQNQQYPIRRLLRDLKVDDSLSLFRVVILLENIHQKEHAGNLPGENDLIFSLNRVGDRLEGNIFYNAALLAEESLQRLFGCFLNILSQVLTNVNIRLAEIELVDAQQKKELLSGFNRTGQGGPDQGPVYEIFEEQARKYGERIAISCTEDISDIIDELNRETINPQIQERLAQCCFQMNPYYFVGDIKIPGTDYQLKLLKTHLHNSVIVNQNTLVLLRYFDGERNLQGIFAGLQQFRARFYVYTIVPQDLLEISLKVESNKLDIYPSDIYHEFVKLVKNLYQNNLITFKKLETRGSLSQRSIAGEFQLTEDLPAKEVLEKIFEPEENLAKADVLLLGDTPGMSTVGLLYLASYLRRNGFRVYCRFTDADLEYEALVQNIRELLAKIQPAVVGLSMKWFPHIARVLEMARIIKEFSNQIKVVVGGNTASYYATEIIQNESVDYVVKGDGELPFLRICQGAGELPNCAYKEKGKIIDNPITYVQDETNAADIYLSHLDEILISKLAPLFGTFFIYTNKGCVMNCLYCASCREGMEVTFNRKNLHHRDITAIRNDITVAKQYISTFMFDFEASNEDLLTLCQAMWAGMDLSSHFCTFCNVIPPSPELLAYVNKTFKYVYWELDICSLSERHREQLASQNEVKPQPSDREILAFLDEAEQYSNAEIRINLIAGLPYFTEDDIRESERMLSLIMNKYSCFSNLHWARLHAQPGAPVSLDPEKYGMKSYATVFEEFSSFSRQNLENRPYYPPLEYLYYPYVYYQNDELNSKISAHYSEINLKLEEFRKGRKNDPLLYRDLTYRELNDRANQMARVLREKGVKTNEAVAILAESSLDFIVGIIGIIKAGGAYLPIDIEYPAERIHYILEDSGVRILLSREGLADGISFTGEKLPIKYDESLGDAGNHSDKTNALSDLVYIIYTSGSTGKPKGVMIEHRSLSNFIDWRIQKYGFTPEDVTLQLIAPSFDGFGTNFYSSILSGGRLLLIDDKRRRDFDFARKVIRGTGVTNMSVVPVMYRAILENAFESDLAGLRFVILAGDKADKNLIELSKSLKPALQLINEYGPTESTITATVLLGMTPDNLSVIGQPIANNQAYILNDSNNLMPVGVPGELFLAGRGLARGYLNNPDLTVEKFVPNRFFGGLDGASETSPETPQRLYRTGDLARWLPDGNIDFLGRKDYQVKVRGFRIELGEIENHLCEHELIKEAVVIDKADSHGNKYLCAYIVPRGKLAPEVVKDYLGSFLPDYMIPARIVIVTDLPVTLHGKIDRKVLASRLDAVPEEESYEAPRNEIEEKLVNVWKEVLGIEKVGIKDNFFVIGGDSIKAIQISARLQKYQMKLEVKNMFQYPSIHQVSAYVKTAHKLFEQKPVAGEVPLTPIQRWFFETKFVDQRRFNQHMMLYSVSGFEERIVKKVFDQMVMHHDALRMVYKTDQGKTIQWNRGVEGSFYGFKSFDLKSAPDYESQIHQIADEFQGSFDLSAGPLVQLALFHTEKADYLLILIHHLVVDGISWRIIVEDFSNWYGQIARNEEVKLPHKSMSFKEWAEELNGYANRPRFLKQIGFWKKLEEVPILPLPKEMVPDTNQRKDECGLRLELSLEETMKLLQGANRPYNTEINDLLITALAITIKEWTGQNQVLISLEGHGREEIIENTDITRTVGWFSSEYPIIINITGSEDLGCHIKSAKESLRRTPYKGMGYGILKYLTANENKEDLHFNLHPEISFNYLGQFGPSAGQETFGISDLSAGSPLSPLTERLHTFDIVGSVFNGRLVLEWRYNVKEYQEKTIMNLVNRYQKHLEAVIDHCFDKVETELTPSDVGDRELTNDELDSITKKVNGKINKIYPLSPMQEGMLYHVLANEKVDPYIEQTSLGIQGDLDINVLRKSFQMIIERNDILRTVFSYEGLKRPRQVVLNEIQEQVSYEDISSLPQEQKAAWVEAYKRDDAAKRFDLTQDVLLRASVLKLGDGAYKMIWDFHHIIMDGWCLGVIIKEFFKIYKALKFEEPLELETVAPYKVFIDWLEEQDQAEALAYWKNFLKDYEHPVKIPQFEKIPPVPGYKREDLTFYIDETVTKGLVNLSIKTQVTLNAVIQSIWGILLSKYNLTQDAVFGTVVAGRPPEIPEIEKMTGLFINTIPVRVKFQDDTRLVDLIQQFQTQILSSEKYQYYPLAEIQANTGLRHGLFDHILAFENYPIDKEVGDSGIEQGCGFKISEVETYDVTNYDFNLVIVPGTMMMVRVIYNANLFDGSIMNQMGAHFANLMEQVVENPSRWVKDLRIVTSQEQERFSTGFHPSGHDYPRAMTANELFERQAEITPRQTALVFKDHQLTYEELNRKSNQLARVLRAKGAGPKTLTAIMLDRSAEAMICILGVLKAGGAYLPVDPDYPANRIEYILNDSGAEILLSKASFSQNIRFHGEIFNFDYQTVGQQESSNLETVNKAEDLAYVIYTSGSTGQPKGVMLEHKGIANLMVFFKEHFGIHEDNRVLQFASLSFDASVWEMVMGILTGAALYIVPKEIINDSRAFEEFINQNEITVATLPPTYLVNLNETRVTALKKLIVAGSASTPELFNRWKDRVEYINAYGPTETTICASVWRSSQNALFYNSVPIGRPIYNAITYILDRSGNFQPVGAPGELCVGGDIVARGYLNKPELTAEKFIVRAAPPREWIREKPQRETPQRIYRTGDLARWAPDENIEFMGRIDDQIKIRGYRIEPSEIERRLLNHEAVKEAVVVAKDGPQDLKYLSAYLVAAKELAVAELREYLVKDLPEYMIPSFFTVLEKMPLNTQGKIDRNTLPDPIFEREPGAQYIAPRNPMEIKITEIWREILGISEIGVHDSFFEIGGNSILLIRMFSQFEVLYPGKIKITDIFANPTIAKLAQFIGKEEVLSDISGLMKPIQLPPDFLISRDEYNESAEFTARIQDDFLKDMLRISAKEGIGLPDILLATYMYLFAEITKQKTVTVHVLSGARQGMPLTVNLATVTDFTALFQAVYFGLQVAQDGQNYQLDDLQTIKWSREACDGVPLFCQKKNSSNRADLTDIYDIILEIEGDTAGIDLTITYNNLRIKKEKMKQLFEGYLKLTQFIGRKYQDISDTHKAIDERVG